MSDWYVITDQHPPLGALVIVKWDWREFAAMRGDGKGGRRWQRFDEHARVQHLPPAGERDQWSDAPIAWRPVMAEHWPDPLPERKVLSTPGRFVDARPGRQARMMRQAEEAERIKAEIEAEIGTDSAEHADTARRPKDNWWLDPESVTYSPAGEISPDEAEARILRAILTDGLRMIERPLAFKGTAGALASLVAEVMVSTEGRNLFEPTRQDRGDYLEAMQWFAAIAPLEERPRNWTVEWLSGRQKVLVYRAGLWSWRSIAKRQGGSHETWRKTYGSAIDRIWRAANGRPVADHFTVADQVALLRERNRTWKRKQGAE